MCVGERKYGVTHTHTHTHPLISVLGEIELHTPALLSCGMGLLHAVRSHLCGLHYQSGICGQESNLLLLPVIETRLPGRLQLKCDGTR